MHEVVWHCLKYQGEDIRYSHVNWEAFVVIEHNGLKFDDGGVINLSEAFAVTLIVGKGVWIQSSNTGSIFTERNTI